MNLSKTGIVISREYLNKVKKKSFLITTFVVPVLFAAICILPSILMMNVKEKSQKVAVVDYSGIVVPFFEDSEAAQFTDCSGENPEELKNELKERGFDVLVVVSALDSSKNVSLQTFSKKPAGVDFSESIRSKASKAVEQYRISSYDISGLDKILKDVKADVKVNEFTLDESGNATVSESGIYMIISMLLGMLIYMFIAMFGGSVMSSVIEEKSSRVVEVLVSSVKATELMFGKIIGIALVALTQFVLWIVLTLVLVTAAGAIFGFQDLAASAEMTQGMAGVDMAAMAQNSEASVIFTTLSHIPWGTLIVSFLVFFVLGYLLYASMYAAIGSAVENEADSQQLQLPVTIPLMLAFFIVFFAFKNPDSAVVFWGSMIPFTSPIVMLARIPYGVPFWELALSIVLLLGTFIVMAWASAKIYKAGILMFGKKSNWNDLFKWLKQK